MSECEWQCLSSWFLVLPAGQFYRADQRRPPRRGVRTLGWRATGLAMLTGCQSPVDFCEIPLILHGQRAARVNHPRTIVACLTESTELIDQGSDCAVVHGSFPQALAVPPAASRTYESLRVLSSPISVSSEKSVLIREKRYPTPVRFPLLDRPQNLRRKSCHGTRRRPPSTL